MSKREDAVILQDINEAIDIVWDIAKNELPALSVQLRDNCE